MKVVAYARVSSREQEKEGFSIPAQTKLLEEYAQRHGMDIVGTYSEAETAKCSGREEFGKMLDYLKRSKDVRTILVEKTDRLYRNFKDFVRLEELDVEIHLVKENEVLNKDSRSHVKFIHGIKVLMAKNYIDNLSEEVKKGMNEKAEQGHFPFIAPYGYKNNKQTRMIDVNEDEAPFVQRAFTLYGTSGYSLNQLADQLLVEGFCFKPSQPKIQKGTLDAMLKNIFYTGDFKIKGKFYKGKHQPLVSLAEFEQVQRAFSKVNRPKEIKREFAFAGLMTCGRCGCSITGQMQKGKYIYYHCTNHKGGCNDPYIREENIAEQFGEILKKLDVHEAMLNDIIATLKSSHQDEIEFHQERIQSLQDQYNRLTKRVELIYEDKLDGKIPEDLWFRKNQEYRSELTRLEATLSQHTKGNLDYVESGVQILELAKSASRLYFQKTPLEQRRLLNFLFLNCTMEAGNVSATYKKPFDIIAEGANSQEWWAIGDLNTGPHPYQWCG